MLSDGKALTFSQAAKIIPAVNGRRPHANSVWRWARKGLNGVKLEVWKVGRCFVTTQEALERFFVEAAKAEPQPRRCANGHTRPISRFRTREERDRAVAQAERSLEATGFGNGAAGKEHRAKPRPCGHVRNAGN